METDHKEHLEHQNSQVRLEHQEDHQDDQDRLVPKDNQENLEHRMPKEDLEDLDSQDNHDHPEDHRQDLALNSHPEAELLEMVVLPRQALETTIHRGMQTPYQDHDQHGVDKCNQDCRK